MAAFLMLHCLAGRCYIQRLLRPRGGLMMFHRSFTIISLAPYIHPTSILTQVAHSKVIDQMM